MLFLTILIDFISVPGMPIHIKGDSEISKDNQLSMKDLSYLKALDGFVLVISSDGDLIYLSENVSEYLGVSQVSMYLKV